MDFAALDLTPYFAGLAASLARAEDWRSIGIDTDWFGNFVADIRLSAASVKIGALAFGNIAASVALTDGRMEIGLAEAAFDGGSVTGALTVTDIPDMPEANYELQLRATDFDLARAAPAFGLPGDLSGMASLSGDVAAGGHGFTSLMTTLGGSGTLSIENGSVPLFGIAEIAAGAPGSAGGRGSGRPGRSARARVSASAGGIATLEEVVIRRRISPPTRPARSACSTACCGLTGTVQPAAGAPPRAFQIDGTLAAPQVSTQALAN